MVNHLKLLSRLFRLTSSWIITSRGFDPMAAPTTPAFSNWSIRRPARL